MKRKATRAEKVEHDFWWLPNLDTPIGCVESHFRSGPLHRARPVFFCAVGLLMGRHEATRRRYR
jgi:hypothetical protein